MLPTLALLIAGGIVAQPAALAAETKYLCFQIFTYNPNPAQASMGENSNHPAAGFPNKKDLANYIEDITNRIGNKGDSHTKLAVIFGPLSFDHTDAEVADFIKQGFDLAVEKNVAVGFHIDDSMFWAGRKDLAADPKNVEALDWDGTPCTGRRLDWGKDPSEAPPQLCFNSKAVEHAVDLRAALIGRTIQSGVKQLRELGKPDLFAGAIAGWETMIGQDFKTGKPLGYRALLNLGFSRQHPPPDMAAEREQVVQEFIDRWAKGLAGAGVPPQKIYSHTAFLSHRAFNLGDRPEVTYMKRTGDDAYSQHNHFAPPPVAFGPDHRPGFSTYPQPGLYDEIYAELARHGQTAWASSEGTDMQPESGPGQSGMNMETYLARMFNHGASLVNLYSWGIGGEANRNMGFRVVTEGPGALQAYRKFLSGQPLTEAPEGSTIQERLPTKIHRIQIELPAWLQKTHEVEKATQLMQTLDAHLRANELEEAEKTADTILQMIESPTPN
jgi:hypothetical protein